MNEWISITNGPPPRKGSRLLVFTPSNPDLRYRIVDEDLLRTMREATHWAYLSPPAEYFSAPTGPTDPKA